MNNLIEARNNSLCTTKTSNKDVPFKGFNGMESILSASAQIK